MSSDWAIPQRQLHVLQGHDRGVQEHLCGGRGMWPDGGVLHPKECGGDHREGELQEHHEKGDGSGGRSGSDRVSWDVISDPSLQGSQRFASA